jgi:hypothetical protein
MADLAGQDVAGWSDQEVHDGLSALLRVANQLDAVLAGVVVSFDARCLAETDGFRSVRSWLQAFGRVSQGVASGLLGRGRLLHQLPALDKAARAGTVTPEHVRKVRDLVDHVGIAAVTHLDELLASEAEEKQPHQFERTCRRIRDHLDPDGDDPGAGDRRCLFLSRVGSLVYINGKLDLEGGATLQTALDALMPPPSPDDPRSTPQRRADALIDLADRCLSSGVPTANATVRPHVGILLTPQALIGARRDANVPASAADPPPAPLGAVTTTIHSGQGDGGRPPDRLECAGIPLAPDVPWNEWVGEIPVAVAQRLACDCEAWRAVLDPASGLPLEVGRAYRIVPRWLRRALHARDRGCRWPGCTVPAAWTEVHHLLAWYHGGASDPDNCLLLCRYHHGLVHHERPEHRRWAITLDPATGEVTVTRPLGRRYELSASQPYRPQDAEP